MILSFGSNYLSLVDTSSNMASHEVKDISIPFRRSRNGIHLTPRPIILHLYRIDDVDGHSFHLIGGGDLTTRITGKIYTILDSFVAPTYAQAHAGLRARYLELNLT